MNWRTMRAEQRDEILSAYLDDELGADVRGRLEEQLAVNPQLRAELDSLRQTVVLVRQMRPVPLPRNFVLPQTMARVQPARPARLRLAGAAPWLTAATAAVSLLFVLVLGGNVLFSGSGPGAMAPAPLGETDMPSAALEAQVVETTEVEDESAFQSREPAMAPEAVEEAAAPEMAAGEDEGAMAAVSTSVPRTGGGNAPAEEPEMPVGPTPDVEHEKAAEQEIATSDAAPPAEQEAAPPAPTDFPQGTRTGAIGVAPEELPPAPAETGGGEEGMADAGELRMVREPARRPVSLWGVVGIFLGFAAVALTVVTVMAWRARHHSG